MDIWNGECAVQSFQDTAGNHIVTWTTHLKQRIYTFPCPVMLRNFTYEVTINWCELGDELDIYPTLLVAKLVTNVGFMIELNPSFDAFIHRSESKWSCSGLVNTYGKNKSLVKLPHDTRF